MRTFSKVAIASLLLAFPHVLLAQPNPAQNEVLKLIRETAKDLCDLPTEGHSTNTELSIAAQAKVAGLLKKVTDLGVETSAKYASKASQAALVDKDVLPALNGRNRCRLHIYDDLSKKLLPSVSSVNAPPRQVSDEEKQPPRTGYLDRPGLYIGMTKEAFSAALRDIDVEWIASPDGLMASYDTSYLGQNVKASYYFSGNKINDVYFSRKISHTSGYSVRRDSEGPSAYRNKYSESEVTNLCADLMRIPSAALGRFGEPIRPAKREEIDYRGWADREEECKNQSIRCIEEGEANNYGVRVTLNFRPADGVKAEMFVENFMRGYKREVSRTIYSTKYWNGCILRWRFYSSS
jgi:hypothetical protein